MNKKLHEDVHPDPTQLGLVKVPTRVLHQLEPLDQLLILLLLRLGSWLDLGDW